MTTKVDLRKLREGRGDNDREKSLNYAIGTTIEDIRRNARKGLSGYMHVIFSYRDDEEYCKSFLTSITEVFPDIDVTVSRDTTAKYYDFSWKE